MEGPMRKTTKLGKGRSRLRCASGLRLRFRDPKAYSVSPRHVADPIFRVRDGVEGETANPSRTATSPASAPPSSSINNIRICTHTTAIPRIRDLRRVYVDEDSKAAAPVDSSGDKDDDDKSGSAAAEIAAADAGATENAATASEAVDGDDDSTGVTSDEEEVAGSDDDAYSATDSDNYLEYEDDIADGLDSLKIDGDATPPIFLDDSPPPIDDSPPPIDDSPQPIDAVAAEKKEPAYSPPIYAVAVEEEPACATEYEQLCFDGQYGYLTGGGYSYGNGGGAYYGDPYQYQYPATYYPSYYLPRQPGTSTGAGVYQPPHYVSTYTYGYGYNTYAGEPFPAPPPPPPLN